MFDAIPFAAAARRDARYRRADITGRFQLGRDCIGNFKPVNRVVLRMGGSGTAGSGTADMEADLDPFLRRGGSGRGARADDVDFEASASSIAFPGLYPFLRKHARGRNVAPKGGGGKHLGDSGVWAWRGGGCRVRQGGR